MYNAEKEQQRRWKEANPDRLLLYYARQRAKELGLACTITREDCAVPTHCPALGIELKVNSGGKGFKDESPSLDRIDPAKGYVPGNVVVISFRANRIKHNATAVEIKAVAEWLERVLNV